MEFIEGQSFSEMIKAGPVPSYMASSVALDVLHGLAT
jgi:hypothetical protein